MPTPVTTPLVDFTTWSQENLANLARDLWTENQRVREDLKLVRDAWRAEVIQRGVLVGQPNNLSESA